MQDNAPAHSSKHTKTRLQEHGINFITWPPNSPDLNPIEIIWNWMKQWIQEVYRIKIDSVESQGKKLKPARLRQIVQEAWEQITEEQLDSLVRSMHQRCQDVIDTQGGHTRW
jgi:transposase